MENTETPQTIWKINHHNMMVRNLTFISIHPNNPRYAIYLDHESEEPIRAYIPNLWESFHRSQIGALSKAEYIANNRLERIREKIAELGKEG